MKKKYSGSHLLIISVFFGLFLSGPDLFAEKALVQSITSVGDWQPHQIQEVRIQLSLPNGFHAYQDQFKVLNIEPEGFIAGQIHVKPEIEFFDKFSGQKRKGFKEQGEVTVLIEAPSEISAAIKSIHFDLRHQICSESVCYLPQNLPIEVKVNTGSVAAGFGPKISDSLQESLQTNVFFAFVFVFFAGVLTSFTPCIFPMLPITISILGYHANKGNRWHNFSRALSYVLGIAITYSMLGVVAALTGQLFGSALSNKYILASLCFLFVMMALSMWGVFEIQVPAFIRNRFGSGKSHGLGGAFVMGLVAGIVASPCVGPVLVSILSFISTTKQVFLGFGLMFTFAMGLGMLFIFIGLFSHALQLLPKSGAWMDFIKFILGAGMWVAALYYAQFLMMHRWWLAIVALSFLILSIWKGAFHFRKKNYIKQSFLLALFIFSSSVFILSFIDPDVLSRSVTYAEAKTDLEVSKQKIVWQKYSPELLKEAQAAQQPVLLDFFAEWCGACHELEEKTYTNPEFVELSTKFKLIKVDATQDNPETQKILAQFGVQGLPTVLFINKKGEILKNLTFTQFIEWKDLKPKMQESLQ